METAQIEKEFTLKTVEGSDIATKHKEGEENNKNVHLVKISIWLAMRYVPVVINDCKTLSQL